MKGFKKRAVQLLYAAGWVFVLAIAALRFGLWSPNAIEPYAAGQNIASLNSIRFSAAEKTVLLFLRSDCHFCKESMDFYRRLIASGAVGSGRVRVVVIGPESSPVLTRYASDNALAVQQVVSATNTRLRGTPTVLIADRAGVVEGVWEGKVNPYAEQDIIDAVASSSGELATLAPAK